MKKLYLYFVTLPDRLYPFARKVGGRWVRGRRSYNQAARGAFRAYGPHHLGFKLVLYRSTFHLVGSIVFIVAAAFVSKTFFGSDSAVTVLLCAAIAALFFQELYLHPKLYGQQYKKSVADLFAWVTPIAAYLYLF